MTSVVMLWRVQLRRQWRSWALLTLVMAIGVGAGLACLAGARRTASAFDRFAAGDRFLDVNSGHGLPPQDAEAAIAELDGVENHLTLVGFIGSVEDLDPTAIRFFVATWDEPAGRFRPTLRAGRYPDAERVDEVLVLGDGAQRAGIEIGARLTVQLFGGATSGITASGVGTDLSQTFTHRVTVVGLADDPLDSVADATYDRTGMIFTPAFARANASTQQAWSASDFVAASGSGEDELGEQLTELGWSIDETRTTAETRVQDAIRPLVAVLALLGALLLATTLLVVGQSLARRADATEPDRDAIRAMGVTRRGVRAVEGSAALSVAVPGALLALLVAIAMSTLFPTGSVARLDPAHGHFADGTVLGLGAVASVVALVALGRSRSGRVGPLAAARPLPAVLGALGPQFTPGLRLAAGGTTRERYDFWRSVALTTGGLCLLIGAITFVASLAALRDEPLGYGAGWELTARNAFGDVPPDAVSALTESDKDIEGIAGGTLSSVLVGDQLNVPMMAFSPITADLWPTVTAGDSPRADNEVLVGADVLSALDAEIGDEITIRGAGQTNARPGTESPASSASDATMKVTVVGTAVFPSIELAGLDPARLGNGIAMTWTGYQSLTARSGFEDPAPDMTFFDLADGVDPALVAERYPNGVPESAFGAPTDWLTSVAPAEVIETDRATGLIKLVIALLAIVVAASLVHALSGSVRDHRRDYATLKAIGFTRRQIVSLVAWQSLTPVVVALAIALPVGAALGRWCWQLLAEMIGVVSTGVVPLLGVGAVAVVALVAAGLLSVLPGMTVARTPAATLLRDE